MFSKNSDKVKTKDDKDLGVIEFIKFVLLTLIIVVPVRMYVAQPFVVNGASMAPTLATGQYLVVDQLTYHIGKPQRGDVIVFKFPLDTSKFFIKRVIGLPGEKITVKGEEVIIESPDSQETITLTEPYVELVKNSYSETTLKENEYFVMGDNREASLDSRVWGPLNKKYIIGRAYVRLLPFSEAGFHPGRYQFDN
jgi:signal peptidase I